MNRPTFTLQRTDYMPAVRRMLAPPILVCVAMVVAVAMTRDAIWLTVGGTLIAGWGALFVARRLFRLRPHPIDDPPPMARPPQPGQQFAALNLDHLHERAQRSIENRLSRIGVWLSVGGSFIASIGPLVFDLIKHTLTHFPV